MSEFLPGVNPGGNITRTTTGNFTIERLWQVSLRGRVGYTVFARGWRFNPGLDNARL